MTVEAGPAEHRPPAPATGGLAAWRALVEGELDRLLPREDGRVPGLAAAVRHAVAGGKRLRPLLVLAAAGAAGHPEPESLVRPACALELIHQYSLVHDDLPALDDDPERRGRPSCHVLFGEAMAILVGDTLLTLAFETLAQPVPGVPAERQLAVLAAVAAAAGHAGMVAGQVLDLALAGRLDPAVVGAGPDGGPTVAGPDDGSAVAGTGPDDGSAGVLTRVNDLKTGALFRACARAGGLLAGASPAVLARLDSFALWFGRAFQIADDLADDGAMVSLLGRAGAAAAGLQAVERAAGCLADLGAGARPLAELLAWPADRLHREPGLPPPPAPTV